MFRILRDLADNECPRGKLPIHVRLWADEYYAGPKPADSEMLLGEIRSRNISMVPILQDVSQLKTLFPQDKWEIFSSNCSAVVYLGSGPTAYTTHKWISDMLGEMTIDTRSDTISQGRGGGGSLQNSKAGMKLMTPEQVREMPNRDCILLIEGMKPVYDRKNRPFATKQWKEAEIAAGPDGYTNPIRILHDKEKDIYKTVDCEEKIIMVDKAEEQFYRNAAATDKTIRFFDIDKEAFLYLNWDEDKPLTMEEIQAIAKTAKKKDVSMMKEPDDVKKDKNTEEAIQGTKNYDGITPRMKWNLKGSFSDCILRYGEQLTPEEMEILSQCLKDGLSDRQMKKILILPDACAMENYRKIFLSANRSR